MNTIPSITIRTGKTVAPLGDLFGIFFEDLNHAADGGLYAELVQNRSFEFDKIDNASYHALTAWETVERPGARADFSVETVRPLHAQNPHYLAIKIKEAGGGVGVRNLGFAGGIPIGKGKLYHFSFYARRTASFDQPVEVTIESGQGVVYGAASVTVDSDNWEKYTADILADATDTACRLSILTKGEGSLYLDMVTLFPDATFRARKGGLRADIAEHIAALRPKFMRFPGGCLVHDGTLDPAARDSMYRWKNTVGDVEERPARRSNWGYNQTLGLGFFEYFVFCEDIDAKPIPVLPAGCDPHHKRFVPLNGLQPWIDDALDLIEFATGGVSTPWGAKRAAFGHPKPFDLEYIGIGNEEVDEAFFERFALFVKAIKAKYPSIRVIGSSGPFAAGSVFERGWRSARETGADAVDEHYYQSPEWFLANIHRYDSYKPDGPKAFLGEYASCGDTYYNALAEAAYMTALQNNARTVSLACYAPLLCNTDYVNWQPDMIWFNNRQVYGTPSYYVQKLFMNHQGTALLATEDTLPQSKAPAEPPIIGQLLLGVDRCIAEFSGVTLTNDHTGESIAFPQADTVAGGAEGSAEITLGGTDWNDYTLCFKAKKILGERGLRLTFGRKDENNRLSWEIGGWQNQDSAVFAAVNGRNSCLTHEPFTVETGVEYDFALSVSGRRVRTYVDGRLYNETVDRLPAIEPLYYTASADETDRAVILKAVNVSDRELTAQIVLEGLPDANYKAEVFQMAGDALEAKNSFEEPEKVVPHARGFQTGSNRFEFIFLGRSVTVLKIVR